LGCLTPSGCQRSSARDAWSTPQDTVQSPDNLESWGTLFAPRSWPPLSCGPHHDPGVPLSIQAIQMLIIRAVIRRHFRSPMAQTGEFSGFDGQTLPTMLSGGRLTRVADTRTNTGSLSLQFALKQTVTAKSLQLASYSNLAHVQG